MSQDTVAKRYAQAIFDLGVETSSVRLLADDIRNLAAAFEASRELQQVMDNPLVAEPARLAAVHDIAQRLGLSRLATNTAGLLTKRKRMACLPAIALELDRLTDEQSRTQRVTVVSAEPLSEPYAERLTRELEHMTGRSVVLERKLDPELLAGVVIKLGDQIIDGSARARLADLRSQLLSA